MSQKDAEQAKYEEFYSPDYDVGEEEEEDSGCVYDFGDECVEPSLRNMGNCFECWLFQEVDADDRKIAATEEKAKP
jgi:hypothetical protein